MCEVFGEFGTLLETLLLLGESGKSAGLAFLSAAIDFALDVTPTVGLDFVRL